MTTTHDTATPIEIEQRWTLKDGEGEKLKASAENSHLIIQGYLGDTVTVSGTQRKTHCEVIVADDRDMATLQISGEGVDATPLLSIGIPKAEGKSLKGSGLLNHMRLRCIQDHKTNELKTVITIKGQKINGEAPEYEYATPVKESLNLMLNDCREKMIQKIRYNIPGGVELDYFQKQNLYLAEREVDTQENMLKELPEWAAEDITNGGGYSNYSMAGEDPLAVMTLTSFKDN